MRKKIGIIYSSVDGHTKKISEVLLYQLNLQNIKVELFSLEDFNEDVTAFDLLVIGASVRYGEHNKNVRQFVLKNKNKLGKITTAFFSVNLVARKSDKNSPKTNPYLIKFLKKVSWKPDLLAVFAGKLDYSACSFWDRIMIKLIMKFTHGPTRSNTTIEFTNWEKVREFGEVTSRELQDFSYRR